MGRERLSTQTNGKIKKIFFQKNISQNLTAMSETVEESKVEPMELPKPVPKIETKDEETPKDETEKKEIVEETKPEEVYPEIDNPRETLSEFWEKLHEKQWVFPSGGSLTLRSGEEIFMTPKMKSPFDVKPDEIYVSDNEDKDDMTEAPEHLEVSSDADLLMAIYKLRKPGAILHSVNCQAMIASHLFRGNEYKLRYQAMIQGILD